MYSSLNWAQHGMRYVMVSEQRLLGTYVLVMASAALSQKIRHVQSEVIPTGLRVSDVLPPLSCVSFGV